MQLAHTACVQYFNTRDDRGKTHTACQKRVMSYVYNKPKSNLTKQNDTENTVLFQTRQYFSPMCVQLEDIGYWSETRGGQLSTAQTTPKSKYKLHSRYLYCPYLTQCKNRLSETR
jgi:hypothetical protein